MKKWWDEWGLSIIVFTGIVVFTIILVNWIDGKPIGDFIFFVEICIIFFQRPYNLMCKDEQFLKVNQNWV